MIYTKIHRMNNVLSVEGIMMMQISIFRFAMLADGMLKEINIPKPRDMKTMHIILIIAQQLKLTMRRNIVILFFIIPIFLSGSFLLFHFDIIKSSVLIEYEFLFTFIGIFLGFAITLFTYLASIFDKILLKLSEQKNTRINKLRGVYNEIIDDIWFLFISLIIITLLIITKSSGKIKCDDLFNEIENAILLTILIMSFFAIRDLISVSFKISKYILPNDEEKEETTGTNDEKD